MLYGGSADGGEPTDGRIFYFPGSSGAAWVELHPVFEGEESDRGLPASVGHGAVSLGENLYYWGGTSGTHRLNGLWRLQCLSTLTLTLTSKSEFPIPTFPNPNPNPNPNPQVMVLQTHGDGKSSEKNPSRAHPTPQD